MTHGNTSDHGISMDAFASPMELRLFSEMDARGLFCQVTGGNAALRTAKIA
jgi:hypothetical protein